MYILYLAARHGKGQGRRGVMQSRERHRQEQRTEHCKRKPERCHSHSPTDHRQRSTQPHVPHMNHYMRQMSDPAQRRAVSCNVAPQPASGVRVTVRSSGVRFPVPVPGGARGHGDGVCVNASVLQFAGVSVSCQCLALFSYGLSHSLMRMHRVRCAPSGPCPVRPCYARVPCPCARARAIPDPCSTPRSHDTRHTPSANTSPI